MSDPSVPAKSWPDVLAPFSELIERLCGPAFEQFGFSWGRGIWKGFAKKDAGDSMKKELMDYFKVLLDHYAKYHNHKEVSAWAGLVLYIAFCAFAIRFPPAPSSKHTVFLALAIAVVVVIVSVLVFLYIQNQLKMKDTSGAWVVAALWYLTEITCADEQSLNCEKYPVHPSESIDRRAQATPALPKMFLDKAEILNKQGRGFQDRTRWLIYSLLFVSTACVVGLKILEAAGFG